MESFFIEGVLLIFIIFMLYIPWLREALVISVGHTLLPDVNEYRRHIIYSSFWFW